MNVRLAFMKIVLVSALLLSACHKSPVAPETDRVRADLPERPPEAAPTATMVVPQLPAIESTVKALPLPAGYVTYELPGWASIQIPDDWRVVKADRLGRIALSNDPNAGAGPPLSSGSGLVLLFQFGEFSLSPLENLRQHYLPMLGDQHWTLERPRTTMVQGRQAAELVYLATQPEGRTWEWATLVAGEERNMLLLAICLEQEVDAFRDTFQSIQASLVVLPISPQPAFRRLEGPYPPGLRRFESLEEGYSFYYPEAWQVHGTEGMVTIVPPAGGDIEPNARCVILVPPPAMERLVEGDEPSPKSILARLYVMLGRTLFYDAQITSRVRMIEEDGQILAAAYLSATRNGHALNGLVAYVGHNGRYLGLVAWFCSSEMRRELLDSVVSTMRLTEREPVKADALYWSDPASLGSAG